MGNSYNWSSDRFIIPNEAQKKIIWLRDNGTVSINKIMSDIKSYYWNHSDEWLNNFLDELIEEQLQKKIKLL